MLGIFYSTLKKNANFKSLFVYRCTKHLVILNLCDYGYVLVTQNETLNVIIYLHTLCVSMETFFSSQRAFDVRGQR